MVEPGPAARLLTRIASASEASSWWADTGASASACAPSRATSASAQSPAPMKKNLFMWPDGTRGKRRAGAENAGRDGQVLARRACQSQSRSACSQQDNAGRASHTAPRGHSQGLQAVKQAVPAKPPPMWNNLRSASRWSSTLSSSRNSLQLARWHTTLVGPGGPPENDAGTLSQGLPRSHKMQPGQRRQHRSTRAPPAGALQRARGPRREPT